MNAYPAENQQHLLLEHGLDLRFAALWASIGDGHEVAQRLHVPADSIETCDFDTAMRSYAPLSQAQRVWITPHAPGWSHVLVLSGWKMPSAEKLSFGGQHVFEVSCIGGVEEVEELVYTYDGASTRDFFDKDEYRTHWADLPYDDMLLPAEELEQHLIIMGRITGRFLDRDWISSQGLLCTIP
jgi:hypothetical protein